jgi:hypothetical protein
MGPTHNCSVNMPSMPYNYVNYDGTTMFSVPFIFNTDRFPPKYEDAIKLPSATPRRSSCSALPPPFYDNAIEEQQGLYLIMDPMLVDYESCQIPTHQTLPWPKAQIIMRLPGQPSFQIRVPKVVPCSLGQLKSYWWSDDICIKNVWQQDHSKT